LLVAVPGGGSTPSPDAMLIARPPDPVGTEERGGRAVASLLAGLGEGVHLEALHRP